MWRSYSIRCTSYTACPSRHLTLFGNVKRDQKKGGFRMEKTYTYRRQVPVTTATSISFVTIMRIDSFGVAFSHHHLACGVVVRLSTKNAQQNASFVLQLACKTLKPHIAHSAHYGKQRICGHRAKEPNTGQRQHDSKMPSKGPLSCAVYRDA
jgi:hypothetical protein